MDKIRKIQLYQARNLFIQAIDILQLPPKGKRTDVTFASGELPGEFTLTVTYVDYVPDDRVFDDGYWL